MLIGDSSACNLLNLFLTLVVVNAFGVEEEAGVDEDEDLEELKQTVFIKSANKSSTRALFCFLVP